MVSDSLRFCSPETKLKTVAEIMKNSNYGALPVVDNEKKIVGLLKNQW
jgi:predicted transcriptional regulator